MNIYDTANKLAKEIKESKEYSEYKKLKSHIEENPNQKTKVEEFEHLRYKIQLETMKGNSSKIEEEKGKLLKYQQMMEQVKERLAQLR